MKTLKNVLYWLTIITLVSLITYFSYKIFTEYKDNQTNIKLQEEISEYTTINSHNNYYEGDYDESKFPSNYLPENRPDMESNNTYNPSNIKSSKFVSADFEALKQENPNTVAWLYIGGTSINYPIVQTTDNKYYLTHNFEDKYNKAGWLFGDYRSNFTNLNRNTVIYGHNQSNYAMFGELKKLKEENWFETEENKYIYLDTEMASYVFEIVSVYITTDNKYIKHGLSNDETYQEFLDYILTNNTIESLSADISLHSKILTLSTCSG